VEDLYVNLTWTHSSSSSTHIVVTVSMVLI